MDSLLLALGSAWWLGVLTSISPCPLATNIAAVSYIGKRVDSPFKVVLAGTLYMLGRTLSYFVVAFIVVKSVASTPVVAMFLQRNMNQFLGPILIVAGVLLLDLIPWPWVSSGGGWVSGLQDKVNRHGIWGALLLGVLFALTFCPVSAALFFGSLIPLAISHESSVLMPVSYGIGTALPVVAFSALIGFAAHRVSRAFDILTHVEPWMRRLTAIVFILVGGYYCLTYIFKLL